MYLHSYIRSATVILQSYEGIVPFASWLKNYFKQNKKFGSKDRRAISDLCFCYFRLGHAFSQIATEERLIIAQFLCHTDSQFVKELKPDWYAYLTFPLEEKMRISGGENDSIFPFTDELSKEVDAEQFSLSHLNQPDLFLRARPGKKEVVTRKLQNAALFFTEEGGCYRIQNNTKVDEAIALDNDAVVQDKSSQKVLDSLRENWKNNSFTAWDCCAASGGKSILLHDLFPKVQLTVSDIRESILQNLRNRFKRAGIQQYQSFVADVSAAGFHSNKKYDVIVCDAPCSGSGTWGRTPEQLNFFTKDKIEHYTKLQKSISLNAIKNLKTDGAFVYITCSVFEKENEEVVTYILESTSLKLVNQRYIKGYGEKADTLFTALFTALFTL